MEKNYDHRNEEEIYKRWEEAEVFKAGKGKSFTILMPPPNANASLHAGQGMYVVEDLLIRFKRMMGFSALWIPGMDHAGFETQYVYEKQLAKLGKSRMDFDRKTLYENVFNFVKENSGLIYKQFKKLGFSADWSRSVFTLDRRVTDRVFETFQKMAKENYIYRSDYMVNYCTHCGTSLAELEVKHVEREDPLYYLKYGPFTLATVRPETKFGDTAVAVHPDDKRYQEWIGKEIEVEGLLGRFKLKVIGDKVVDPEFGTGVVKVTPAHDPNDFEMGRKHGLEIKQVIDLTGRLTILAGKYAGLKVKQAREVIVNDLKEKGLMEKVDEHYFHNVTVCYKCGRDLEPMVIPNWFVRVEKLKPTVIEAVKNKKTKFYPKRFEKHFLAWVEIMHDWPISRQIAWGIRIPAWYSMQNNPIMMVTFLDKNGERVIGFVKNLLEKYSFEEIENGLQTISAPVNAEYKIGKTKPEGDYLQETDTFDTWFSSGQWPLVTLNDDEYKTRFPTDVLGTLSDILKFWVSRMMMFSLYIRNEVPFKNVYLWSMVADAKGVKMSKSKGNVVNPIDLVDKYGADAFRMTLLFGTGEGSKVILSDDKVRGMRNFANKIWNAGRFIKELRIDEETKPDDESFNQKMKEIIEKVTTKIDGLKLCLAAETVYEEFWHWFCDRAIEENKQGKISNKMIRDGYITFLKLLHPFMPFVTEAVWKELGEKSILAGESWPVI